MATKAKSKSTKNSSKSRASDDNKLAAAIRESGYQIWLAGVGAFAKAREERNKVFEALVREGRGIQLRTRALAEERIGDVSDKVNDVSKRASDSWDKLEQVFEDRVSRALGRLGVPTSKDINALIKRVDDLSANVEALGGKVASRPAAAKSAKKAPAKRKAGAKAAKKAAKKPAAKRASRKASASAAAAGGQAAA